VIADYHPACVAIYFFKGFRIAAVFPHYLIRLEETREYL